MSFKMKHAIYCRSEISSDIFKIIILNNDDNEKITKECNLLKGEISLKEYDVTALGELLIDFTENDKSVQGNSLFRLRYLWDCRIIAMTNKRK